MIVNVENNEEKQMRNDKSELQQADYAGQIAAINKSKR